MSDKVALNGIGIVVFLALLMFTPFDAQASNASESIVKDKIDVVEDVIEDSVITAKVKAEIFATKSLETLDIHVETVDGVVTLSGKLNEASAVVLAEKVALSVKGVKKVINELSTYK